MYAMRDSSEASRHYPSLHTSTITLPPIAQLLRFVISALRLLYATHLPQGAALIKVKHSFSWFQQRSTILGGKGLLVAFEIVKYPPSTAMGPSELGLYLNRSIIGNQRFLETPERIQRITFPVMGRNIVRAK